jgi:hypothetical protein
MDKNQFQALGRVLKKLSALRATLRTDDQQALDALVFGEQEVALHAMSDQIQARLMGSIQPRMTPQAGEAAADAASEVAMHSMDPGFSQVQGRMSDQVTPKDQDAASEVAMHSMDPGLGQVSSGLVARISLTSDGDYTITDAAAD